MAGVLVFDIETIPDAAGIRRLLSSKGFIKAGIEVSVAATTAIATKDPIIKPIWGLR